jgi:hypothetical protein
MNYVVNFVYILDYFRNKLYGSSSNLFNDAFSASQTI